MKRRERGRGGIFQRVGQGLLGREIGGADQAEPVDQQHLLLRAAAHQPAILELGGGKRAHQAGFARATGATCRPATVSAATSAPAQAVIRGRPGGALSALASRCRAPRASVLSRAER